MTTHDIDYPAGDITAHGMLALPAGDAAAPGIAVFADIMGLGEHSRRWATRLADELGYVALAADVYGNGDNPPDFPTGMAWLSALLENPDKLVARAQGALAALKAEPRCNGRLGAIGFCFGGSTVLALARAGVPELAAGVSFHGGLKTVRPAAKGNIPAKLLVLHGVADPLDTVDSLAAFLNEMEAAAADCQTIGYTGVGHSFTAVGVDAMNMPGMRYSEATTRRGWNAMRGHFTEAFG